MAGQGQVVFRVVSASLALGHHDLTVSVPTSAVFEDVANAIRREKKLQPGQFVRLICAGREMFPTDSVAASPATVLHATVSESAPPSREDAVQRNVDPPAPRPVMPEPPPPDWLDMIDPGTVLMWVFGSILALLWLLFLVYSSMFDRTSLIILCMMTVAFLLPIALSYLPFPTFLTPHVRAPAASSPAAGSNMYHNQHQMTQQQQQGWGQNHAAYASSVAAPTGLQQRPGAGGYYTTDGNYIPPRPAARVRPGQQQPTPAQ